MLGKTAARSSFIPRFFFNDPATTEIYTLSLHDALPISTRSAPAARSRSAGWWPTNVRSEEHTSELQSLRHLVCRLLLEKKNAHRSRSSPEGARPSSRRSQWTEHTA